MIYRVLGVSKIDYILGFYILDIRAVGVMVNVAVDAADKLPLS
jgi:hypothetical protein